MFKKSLIIATSALALATANVSTAKADDQAGLLIGGIVGGILGSSITKGHKNRNVAIIGGTLLGAVVGDNIANHKHKPQHVERERVEYHEPYRPRHRVVYRQPQNFDPCLRYHKARNRQACRAGQNRHEMQHAYNYGYNNERRYSHNHPWWN